MQNNQTLHRPDHKELKPLASMINGSGREAQALSRWLEWRKEEAQSYLAESIDPVEIHRHQGELRLIRDFHQDIQEVIDQTRKEQ